MKNNKSYCEVETNLIDCALTYSYIHAIQCEIAYAIIFFLLGIPLPFLLNFINKKVKGTSENNKNPPRNENNTKNIERYEEK